MPCSIMVIRHPLVGDSAGVAVYAGVLVEPKEAHVQFSSAPHFPLGYSCADSSASWTSAVFLFAGPHNGKLTFSHHDGMCLYYRVCKLGGAAHVDKVSVE